MKIWIDADACPRDVKDVVFRASARLSVPVVLVANQSMYTPLGSLVTMVQVKGGPDVADDHIAVSAQKGDVVVTHDVPLAARLVPNGVIVIDVRGDLFDEENIGERLSVRDFMADVRDAGVVTGGPRPFTAKDKARFANTLDRALQSARR